VVDVARVVKEDEAENGAADDVEADSPRASQKAKPKARDRKK
jgi:hypothetical protein